MEPKKRRKRIILDQTEEKEDEWLKTEFRSRKLNSYRRNKHKELIIHPKSEEILKQIQKYEEEGVVYETDEEYESSESEIEVQEDSDNEFY